MSEPSKFPQPQAASCKLQAASCKLQAEAVWYAATFRDHRDRTMQHDACCMLLFIISASIHEYADHCPSSLILVIMGDVNDSLSLNLASCSVESLLSVPLNFIFRETQTGDRGSGGTSAASGNHVGFIFSKSECATLLRVSMASMRVVQRSNILLMLILTCKCLRIFTSFS